MSGVPVEVDDLTHEYEADGERVLALDRVRFSVGAGERRTVVGPSGSGKSTLLAALAGLQTPTSGVVRIGGVDVARLSERRRTALRRTMLAVVVQDPRRNLLPYATPLENIRFAQRPGVRRRRRDPRQLLAALGLEHLAHARVDRLSGGERQRVAIATGLALDPGLLLVDEPTSALDERNRDDVLALLERVVEETGTTLLAITHDPAVAARLGGSVRLEGGRVVEEGT